jgi:hypothetical protein
MRRDPSSAGFPVTTLAIKEWLPRAEARGRPAHLTQRIRQCHPRKKYAPAGPSPARRTDTEGTRVHCVHGGSSHQAPPRGRRVALRAYGRRLLRSKGPNPCTRGAPMRTRAGVARGDAREARRGGSHAHPPLAPHTPTPGTTRPPPARAARCVASHASGATWRVPSHSIDPISRSPMVGRFSPRASSDSPPVMP